MISRFTLDQRLRPRARVRWMVVILLGLVGGFGLALRAKNVSPAIPSATASVQQAQGGRDYSRFLHEDHRQSGCASCHPRPSNNSPNPPPLPNHDACLQCHRTQFISNVVPMCMICHTTIEGSHPGVKAFPLTLAKSGQSFRVAFDHAQHLAKGAYPKNGCAACHDPMRRGIALSIPERIPAHRTCFECHTPGAKAFSGQDMSECSTCHQQGRLVRAATTSKAYNVSFSHADHTRRQGMDCAVCHDPRARGTPIPRQMTSPASAQHFGSARGESCMSCHNDKRVIAGRRVFGEENFADCKRCHKGDTFRF